MKIEFLYFKGCPHYPPALALLNDILREENMNHPIEMINVDSDPFAQEIRFLGSPSIRINEKDIEERGLLCQILESNAAFITGMMAPQGFLPRSY